MKPREPRQQPEVTQEDWEAYQSDMEITKTEIRSQEEIEQMFRDLQQTDPFL